MRATAALGLAALCLQAPGGAGHGAIVIPGPPRNALDGRAHPWAGGVPWPPKFNSGLPAKPNWCPIAGSKTDPTKLSGANGQACFWFSNGCSIGCPECDGVTRGPIPVEKGHPMCKGMRPLFPADPKAEANCVRKMDVCQRGHNASVCSAELRTYNTQAECHGPEDWYEFSPWRAPGSAPTFDGCAMAGGKPPPRGTHFGAEYYNTTLAKQGDLGSTLPKASTGVVWKAGSTVEVSWAIEANHGGGYQYRLCKADKPLTEECFKSSPLRFTGSQALRWGGPDGRRENITGHFVTDSAPRGGLVGRLFDGIAVVPAGSIWAQNPIPDFGSDHGAPSFAPRCVEDLANPNCSTKEMRCTTKEMMQPLSNLPACHLFRCAEDLANPNCSTTSKSPSSNFCRCSGEWGPYDLEIVDQVGVATAYSCNPCGESILQLWDCEESNQVWSSCSDVTITK